MKSVQLVSDQDYLPQMLRLVEGAKAQVDLLCFSFAIGSGAGVLNTKIAPYQIAQAFAKAKTLKRRLFIEGERETAQRNRVTARYLANSGVSVRWGASHAKGVGVDRNAVLFGSTNLTQQSLQKNFETNLLIRDPKLTAGFIMYFEHLWGGGQHGEIHLPKPWLADGDFYPALIQMIESATRSLEFSIYFFSLRELEQAFAAAARRGVQIRGLISRHASFARSYVYRTVATVERLRKLGVTDLHYSKAHTFNHSKFLIRDGREVLLGTGNWLQEDVDTHPQLYIQLRRAALARELAQQLSAQIRSSARP